MSSENLDRKRLTRVSTTYRSYDVMSPSSSTVPSDRPIIGVRAWNPDDDHVPVPSSPPFTRAVKGKILTPYHLPPLPASLSQSSSSLASHPLTLPPGKALLGKHKARLDRCSTEVLRPGTPEVPVEAGPDKAALSMPSPQQEEVDELRALKEILDRFGRPARRGNDDFMRFTNQLVRAEAAFKPMLNELAHKDGAAAERVAQEWRRALQKWTDTFKDDEKGPGGMYYSYATGSGAEMRVERAEKLKSVKFVRPR